jgi:hypothetical protein
MFPYFLRKQFRLAYYSWLGARATQRVASTARRGDLSL